MSANQKSCVDFASEPTHAFNVVGLLVLTNLSSSIRFLLQRFRASHSLVMFICRHFPHKKTNQMNHCSPCQIPHLCTSGSDISADQDLFFSRDLFSRPVSTTLRCTVAAPSLFKRNVWEEHYVIDDKAISGILVLF